MKTALNTVRALGAALLLGALALPSVSAAPAPAAAVAVAADKPITLNVTTTTLPNALRLLFQDAGVTRYTIAPDVEGRASLTVQDVPLDDALGIVLRSADPPAAFTVENGVYTVTRKPETAAPAPAALGQTAVISRAVTTLGRTATGTASHTFDSIPINRYDAFIIAALIGAPGITPVPPNEVISAQQIAALQASVNRPQNAGQNGGQNGQQNGRGGRGGRGGRNRGGGGYGGYGG